MRSVAAEPAHKFIGFRAKQGFLDLGLRGRVLANSLAKNVCTGWYVSLQGMGATTTGPASAAGTPL